MKICRVVNIQNVGVPMDADGNYLDWRKVRGDEAAPLTSPYGHFVLGDGPSIILDFAVLPDGQYIMTAIPDAGLSLHIEDHRNAHVPHEVPEAAYHLVVHCVETLERHGVACHEPWDYFRKICTHVGN